jgi:short-subunit dehydrogenase
MSHWQNKYVLITGAGSGIGKALAHNMADAGAKLILTDIKAQTLESTEQELGNSVVLTKVADNSNKEHWLELANSIDSQCGHLDVLVNNAGMSPFGFFDDTSEALFDKVMAVNFSGAVMGCRIMQPLLEKSKRGLIANVASVFGVIAVPMMTSYHASKFALRGFSEALMQDFKYQKKNIDVVCILPGGIKTNIANNAESDVKSTVDFAGHFNKTALTTPARAAKVIEKGMRKKQARILIGPDARIIIWLQKWFPLSYSKVFNPLMGVNKIVS